MSNLEMMNKALEEMINDKEMSKNEKIAILSINLLDCTEHDEEMTNRCNLLSALWQAYRDNVITKKSVYIDLVKTVLKADRETIERLIKNNTVEKGE